jgi:sec-independent protein translocase protein TatA
VDSRVARPNEGYAAAMPGIGHWELILLALVLLLLFGSKQLPSLARNFGRGVREIRETVSDVDPRTAVRELEPPPADKPPA